ncbi:MAG: 8-amino-7-oxononanoate synthase [Planctomycetes bacterium]|nr:8-amino-7-oxononanoate synthase [Planctomycetota bacterium]
MDRIAHLTETREAQSLLRTLNPARSREHGYWHGPKQSLVDLSSNDYLSLSNHPALKQAAIRAIEELGTGAGGSRLLSGDLCLHHQLESRVAQFKNKPSSLVFNSGYQANVGLVSALCHKGDAIFCDRLSHASLLDGARLSGARLFRFQHNDVDHLASLLKKHGADFDTSLVVTESVFSMDGDLAPLKALAELKQSMPFTWLVDEAHATGLFGETGSGRVADQGVTDAVDLVMGTFSKALGSFGAYVACSEEVRCWLINTCRSFIYSTALPPGVIGANLAALDRVIEEPDRREQVLARASDLRSRLQALGWPVSGESQIVPVITGTPEKAVLLSQTLEVAGFRSAPVRPPAVPNGQARVRLSLCYDHDKAVVDRLVACFDEIGTVGQSDSLTVGQLDSWTV